MALDFSINVQGNALSNFDKLLASIDKSVNHIMQLQGKIDGLGNSNSIPAATRKVSNFRTEVGSTDRAMQGATDRVRAFANVNPPKNGPGMMFDNVKSKARDAGKEIDKLESKVKNISANAGGKSGGGFGLGSLTRRLGPLFVGAGLGAMTMGTVNAAAGYEQSSKSFEVLTGSQQTGQNLAGELNSLQQNTILGPEVFKNAQTMLGFGIGVEKVLPNMKMLGDVSMGNADKLERLTLAFSQVQAAGKLMGQDLLQFINAGFNPLSEISKKTGKSMAVLKAEMEDGAISAKTIEDAFVSATGKGGLFSGMLDKMAETTGGKIQQLKGGFEAMKIAIGDRLKPTTDAFVDTLGNVVSKVKAWFQIPISEKLRSEQAEVQTLFGAITSLNEGNDVRKSLLDELVQKYPELLGNIDREKITNSELLNILNDVNSAYERRIGMALTNEDLAQKEKDAKDSMESAKWAAKAEQEFLKGNEDKGNFFLRKANGQPAIWALQGNLIPNKYDVTDARFYKSAFGQAYSNSIGAAGKIKQTQALEANLDRIAQLSKRIDGGDKNIPASVADMVKKTMPSVQQYFNSKGPDGQATINDFGGADFSWLDFAQKTKIAASTVTGTGGAGRATSMNNGISSGGSRPTTINLTIHKLQDQIVLHTTNLQMGAKQAGSQIVEEILQALNSLTNKVVPN